MTASRRPRRDHGRRYSRLMGEDEVGTALAVREHRDAVRPVNAGAPHIPLPVIANWGARQPVAEGG